MESELGLALEFHQQGRYADAARLYHGLIEREPRNAEALHLFGVMHHQCGHSERAIELINRAVAVRPVAAVFYANMAEAHRSLGQWDEAIGCCRAALRIEPKYCEALNNLGLALQGSGDEEEAIERFREAIGLRPEFGMAWNNLGTLLRERGDQEGSLEAYRAAVAVDPSVAEARANLGQALVDLGDLEEGLGHCEEAVRLKEDFAAGFNNLGNAYRTLNRWEEAHRAYAESVRLAPGLAKVHVNRGLAFRGDGRFGAAAGSFRRAIELAPEDVGLWECLARAHRAEEEHAAAIPCYERLITFQPERAQWHNELGWSLAQEGHHRAAEASYARALELRPQMIEAIMNQGSLHEVLGEMNAAEARYRQAGEIDPNEPRVLTLLATLLRGQLPECDRQAIEQRLESPHLSDDQRMGLLFGQAQIADANQEYGLAASALEQANALALEQNRRQGKRYHSEDHERFVDRLIGAFTPELFERLVGMGDDTREPIFVIGMPRSGTTLVEQILASHSRVHGAGELRLARQTFEGLRTVTGRDDGFWNCLQVLNEDGVAALSNTYLDGLREMVERDGLAAAPDRVVDKMPDNYLYVGLISILFPRATLIHVRRDPRDIALSCWMTNFRSIRWANDKEHIALRFEGHRRLTEHWEKVLPGRVREVSYERLVENFEVEARRLIGLCGLEWEPACLEFHRTVRPIRTASVTQVRQPLYQKSVARWTRYEETLGRLYERLTSKESRLD